MPYTNSRRPQCIDCNKLLAKPGAQRCQPCNGKFRRIHPDVKAYRRAWHQKKKYGLDEDGFQIMWECQFGRCWICKKQMHMPILGRGQDLDCVCVDHDHSTGKVRDLLCSACNKGLGYFSDDVSKLKNAINYLSGEN